MENWQVLMAKRAEVTGWRQQSPGMERQAAFTNHSLRQPAMYIAVTLRLNGCHHWHTWTISLTEILLWPTAASCI